MAVNTPPTAVDDSGTYFTTQNDTPFWTISVFSNDIDADGDALKLKLVDLNGTLGTVSHLGYGVFSYDPNGQFDTLAAGEQATDTFGYFAMDNSLDFAYATVTITIVGKPGCSCNYLPLLQRQ
jgi:VCBS repeat-containing protein